MQIDRAVQNLLGELGALLKVPDLAFDDSGAAGIGFEDRCDVSLFLRPEEDEIWLVSDLGVATDPAIYRKLLEANFYWHETRGATLALERGDPPHALLMQRTTWRGLTGKQLLGVLEGFATSAAEGKEMVAKETGAPTADPMFAAEAHVMRI